MNALNSAPAPAPTPGYNFCLSGKSARKAQPVITAPRSSAHCAWLAALTIWDEKFEFGYVTETSSETNRVFWDTPGDGIYQIGYANQGESAKSFFTVTNGLIEFINQAQAVRRLAPRGVLERIIKRLEISEPMTASEKRQRKNMLTLTRAALGKAGESFELDVLNDGASAMLESYAASGNERGGDVVFHTLDRRVIASTRNGELFDEGANVPIEALQQRLEQEHVTLTRINASLKREQRSEFFEYTRRGARRSNAYLPRLNNMVAGLQQPSFKR